MIEALSDNKNIFNKTLRATKRVPGLHKNVFLAGKIFEIVETAEGKIHVCL